MPGSVLARYAERARELPSGIARVIEPKKALVDGVTIETDLGVWSVLETPGHAPSHVCLFQAERRLLISGDHLLGRISLYFDYGWTPDPIGEFEAYLTAGGGGIPEESGALRSVSDREAFVVRTRLVHLFREFPVLDPELPTDLAPPVEGPRRRAVEIFHMLYEGLASASQRHFDDVTGASSLWR